MCCCKRNHLDYQPLPCAGSRGGRSNCSLSNLRQLLNDEHPNGIVYSYVMSTVCRDGNSLRHYGSGPNWQGGVITLCTCKHLMRTFHRPEDWRGTWVAGFSGVGVGDGRNFLIYLMRVGHAFESHWDLWHALPPQVRSAKAADTNPVGDVYKPLGRDTQKDPFNICRYHQPHKSHGRKYTWPADINYQRNNDCRRAALLVGDVDYSFVWDQRTIVFDHNIGRGQRTYSLEDFLKCLQQAN